MRKGKKNNEISKLAEITTRIRLTFNFSRTLNYNLEIIINIRIFFTELNWRIIVQENNSKHVNYV